MKRLIVEKKKYRIRFDVELPKQIGAYNMTVIQMLDEYIYLH